MFELVVIWEDGSEERYRYADKDEATAGGMNFKRAFGRQVMQTLIIEF